MGAFGVALFVGFLYHKGFRITYAPELENSWDAISACAAWAGAIGTIAVLWYNHRSIRLAQYSVQQAINLQLYEKRLALYTDLSKSDAFKESPIELKIVYSEIIYNSHKQIVDLCNQKAELINDLYILATFTDGRVDPCWNICEAEFEKYIHGFSQRMVVKPGLTGLAQVSGGYDLLPEEKIQFDMQYIRERSIALDLKCILRTVGVVFDHNGAR